MSQQAVGFHQREINREMARRGMPTAPWSPEQIAYAAYAKVRNADAWMNMTCERNKQLEAELAKVNESPYSPLFLKAISDTCSTPASRAGKTQAQVFDEEGK